MSTEPTLDQVRAIVARRNDPRARGGVRRRVRRAVDLPAGAL